MNAKQPPRVVGKALILLSELEAADGAEHLSQLSRNTGLAKSTVHRLLADLIEFGMVERSGSLYQAARAKRPDTTTSASDKETLHRLAPFLGDILIKTGLTTSLGKLHGTDVVFPYRVYGHNGTWTPSDDAGREAADMTAAGRLLLAYDKDASRRLTEIWSSDGERLALLNQHLLSIRRQRFAVKTGPKITCVAVPVHSGDGTPPTIALTVKGRSQSFDPLRVLEHLRHVADIAAKSLQPQRMGGTSHHLASGTLRTAAQPSPNDQREQIYPRIA